MLANDNTTQVDGSVVRTSVAYLALLIVFLPLILLGMYGQLFGPQWTFFFGAGGFLCAMAIFGLSRTALGSRFTHACPKGLSERFATLQRLEIPLRRAMMWVGLAATIGLITLAATARLDGVPGTPVFAHREHYVLVNHSVRTEVSRLRYCLAGAGFHVGWHCGALYASLLAIYALIFARVPKPKEL
jgi:hypothetical protein